MLIASEKQADKLWSSYLPHIQHVIRPNTATQLPSSSSSRSDNDDPELPRTLPTSPLKNETTGGTSDENGEDGELELPSQNQLGLFSFEGW